jgi:MinD-like ATPase involved in chromosome partitioning or flagellar assembly
LKRQILAEIPYDGRGMVKSLNQGVPYFMTSPKSPTSLAISALAYKLSANDRAAGKNNSMQPQIESARKSLPG